MVDSSPPDNFNAQGKKVWKEVWPEAKKKARNKSGAANPTETQIRNIAMQMAQSRLGQARAEQGIGISKEKTLKREHPQIPMDLINKYVTAKREGDEDRTLVEYANDNYGSASQTPFGDGSTTVGGSGKSLKKTTSQKEAAGGGSMSEVPQYIRDREEGRPDKPQQPGGGGPTVMTPPDDRASNGQGGLLDVGDTVSGAVDSAQDAVEDSGVTDAVQDAAGKTDTGGSTSNGGESMSSNTLLWAGAALALLLVVSQ